MLLVHHLTAFRWEHLFWISQPWRGLLIRYLLPSHMDGWKPKTRWRKKCVQPHSRADSFLLNNKWAEFYCLEVCLWVWCVFSSVIDYLFRFCFFSGCHSPDSQYLLQDSYTPLRRLTPVLSLPIHYWGDKNGILNRQYFPTVPINIGPLIHSSDF